VDELIIELEKAAAKSLKSARQNYFAAYGLAAIIVGASIAATVLAGMRAKPGITAVVASIPAALFAISITFKFERKSSWHWKKNKRIKSFLRAIKYEGADIAQVSKMYSKLEEEMAEEWVSFGSPLEQRKSRD
jgi:putative flippase GtrA